jgi:hypothetical protein
MTPSPLATKLKLIAGQKAAVVAAPPDYLQELNPLPEGVLLSDHLDGKYHWLQVFIKTESGLVAMLPRIMASLGTDSLLWLTFPKGSSKIQTDLTRDKGWDSLKGSNLKWINLVSVNATWSAFSLRPYRPGEVRQSFR